VMAYIGLAAHLLLLTFYPLVFLAPQLTFIPHAGAAIPLIIWQGWAGVKLLRLARQDVPAAA
jgi:hypothetical protein